MRRRYNLGTNYACRNAGGPVSSGPSVCLTAILRRNDCQTLPQ
jgi:hypothetical protein